MSAEPEFRVWLEAKFMGAPVSNPIEHAKKTVKVAGVWTGSQLTPFEKKDWAKLGLPWTAFESKTRAAASEDFQKFQISFKRDNRKVIEFAELNSNEGLVCSGVLAGELGEKFEDTLGEGLLLAVPSRFRAFLFPKLGSDVSKYSDLVWSAYRETAYPVSVELFEWNKGNIRAIGVFDP